MLARVLRTIFTSSLITTALTASFESSATTNKTEYNHWDQTNQIVNPGMGFTDFHTYEVNNDQYYRHTSYPKTSVIYFRFYWEDIETSPGVFDTSKIDEVFEQARALDKKVVLRFMTLADSYSNRNGTPCWAKVKVDSDQYNNNSSSCDMDSRTARDMYKDPLFRQLAENFINEMGRRYDEQEELLRVDVGMVGSWGEWHMSGWDYRSSNLGSKEIDLNNDDLKPYVDMVDNAFPTTQKTMLIGSTLDDMLSYATSKGMGWRADCLGDWHGKWSHMRHGYPDAIEHAKGLGPYENEYPDPEFDERWKTEPVDFEICWQSMEQLQDQLHYDEVVETFEWALEHHASLINAKSAPIPDTYQSLIQDVLNKLGYQFEIVGLDMEADLAKGQTYEIKTHWINKGVAPSYLDYPISYRIRDSEGNILATYPTNVDIKKWMPSDELYDTPEVFTEKNSITIPSDIEDGSYYLDIGLVEPGTDSAKIMLKNKGVYHDRWYQLKVINIY
ncbi:DUF4832 domain-containing protein [Vibrio sp. HN007]|uniref:DUF4832 domain-containing protein n=1 Tax=Vibrio iocasae TaxID=3098914 RepID=UPI0035D5130C